jgi:hypothetical protein
VHKKCKCYVFLYVNTILGKNESKGTLKREYTFYFSIFILEIILFLIFNYLHVFEAENSESAETFRMFHEDIKIIDICCLLIV